MKKTSIFALLMIVLGFAAKAQTGTYSPAQVFDGMDSITVHYNPYGTGGGHGDTTFQTTAGPLYAYCYLTDSTPGHGGVVGTYNNGSWTGVVTTIDSFQKVSDSDWVWVMPNVRQFFSVPKDVYVQGVNIIVHNTAGDVQSNNLYLPVSESFASAPGQVLTTGPVSSVPSSLLTDGTENVAVYYHPQLDTFAYSPAAKNGDSAFKNWSGGSLYVYSYVYEGGSSAGTTQQLTPWGSVGTTPTDSLVEIDSNDYVFDLPSLRNDFINAGMPSGTSIDTLTIIVRDSTGSLFQTVNLYIPLVIKPTAVANVNANTAKASVYPNPATDAIVVSYSFAQQANATLTITNLMGQTVMTQDLGNRQAGNMYLSIANIPTGVYLVTVSNGTSSTVQRVVKQ